MVVASNTVGRAESVISVTSTHSWLLQEMSFRTRTVHSCCTYPSYVQSPYCLWRLARCRKLSVNSIPNSVLVTLLVAESGIIYKSVFRIYRRCHCLPILALHSTLNNNRLLFCFTTICVRVTQFLYSFERFLAFHRKCLCLSAVLKRFWRSDWRRRTSSHILRFVAVQSLLTAAVGGPELTELAALLLLCTTAVGTSFNLCSLWGLKLPSLYRGIHRISYSIILVVCK